MKFELEVLKLNVMDIVTTSGGEVEDPTVACPGLIDDPYAIEG